MENKTDAQTGFSMSTFQKCFYEQGYIDLKGNYIAQLSLMSCWGILTDTTNCYLSQSNKGAYLGTFIFKSR